MDFTLYQMVQILYWLALSTAAGGVLFVALAAPVIFKTVREHNLILTSVLSVNLEGQHATLLAGSIVTNLLQVLVRVLVICGAVLLLMMIMQLFTINLAGSNGSAMTLRVVLLLVAVGMVLYDRLMIWPKVREARQRYLDHADEPEIANPARDEFDQAHQTSVTILSMLLLVLLGLISFSANITPAASRPIPSATPQTQTAPELPAVDLEQ